MSTIRLAAIADSHLCSSRTPYGFWNSDLLLPESSALWEQALDVVAASGVDGILLLGDVTNFAEPRILESALRTLTTLGKPVLVVAGNHDVGPDGDAVAEAAGRLGDPRIVVPSLAPSAVPGLPGFAFAGVPIRTDDGGGHRVDRTGDPPATPGAGLPLVLLSHYPLIDCRSDLVAQGLRYPDDLRGAPELAQELEDHAVPLIVIHGHLHAQHVLHRAGTLQLAMPPLVEWPHSVTIVTLRRDDSGPSVHRTARSVRNVAAPAGRKAANRGEEWMFRDGCWMRTIPLSSEETPTR